MKWRPGMTLEETQALEAFWAQQLRESRARFVEHVKVAISTSSPTKRRALYQEWRAKYGDDRARDYAKYAEACLEGRVSIEPIERMLK